MQPCTGLRYELQAVVVKVGERPITIEYDGKTWEVQDTTGLLDPSSYGYESLDEAMAFVADSLKALYDSIGEAIGR